MLDSVNLVEIPLQLQVGTCTACAVTCFVALTPRLIAFAKLLAYLAAASLQRISIVASLGGIIVCAYQRNALYFN